MAVEDKIREIIIEQLGVAAEEVVPEASFIDDLGADSLDIVELVMAIEEEFGLEIPDEDAERIQNIGDVISYVEERTAGRDE
jgi:acyl carrier protein